MRVFILFSFWREDMTKNAILTRLKTPSHPLTRRKFLKLTAGGGIGAIAAIHDVVRIYGDTIEGSGAIGLRKQLLVDDHVVSQKHNVTRELTRATKANGG